MARLRVSRRHLIARLREWEGIVGSLRLWLSAEAETLSLISAPPVPGSHAARSVAVTRWTDKSGRGNSASVASGSQPPLFTYDPAHGRGALLFGGASVLATPRFTPALPQPPTAE